LPREREVRILALAGNIGRMKYLAIIAAIIAAIVLSQFLFDFYGWNQQQSCASTGGRNCGGAGPVQLSH
jgi:hypothetical protein